MSTESSSVFVAVRIRPFSAREDTACCTITVPDHTTISVLDVPTLIPSSTAGGPAASAGQHGLSPGDPSTGGSSGGGSGGGTGKGGAILTPSAIEALRHAYSFDKIFWSIAPSLLPFPPPSVLDALIAGDDEGMNKIRVPGLVLPSTAQRALLAQHSAVAKHLPCFATPPPYDDQQRVYDFIGPRMHDAVMSGFNACLFAYGQTGSGKSYSMIGPTEALSAAVAIAKGNKTIANSSSSTSGSSTTATAERGIMPRLFTDLFRRMREEREKDESVTFTAEVSFLEIYCEKVRDLLAVANTLSSSATGYFNASATSGGSLRIRQHPSQGPYVEGLTHVKVRDEESVLRYLLNGLRDRATAGTNMNEHSSRSHAIMQLQLTKVVADADESTGAVVTRTCVSKATMVDLAGSERVSQSGVSGDRFEEAKNINLSLSTLGRVIQQLSEKQSGRHVIPAYRDSVLTWLLSDSLGGNSKTIMLATVAPSAYCYQQTLNTLRFAGVAKKVINVASVNEDRHFQQLIGELRQQIVRLTLQLESGKAAEVHLEKIEALKREKEELLAANDTLKAKATTAADATVLQALRRRVKELEGENEQLREEGQTLQERLLSSTTTLREELAQQRAKVMQLHDTLAKKESEVTEWANRYRVLVLSATSPAVAASSAATATTAAASDGVVGANGKMAGAGVAAGRGGGGASNATGSTPPTVSAEVAQQAQQAQQRLQEEVKVLKTKLHKSTQESAAAQRARQEIADAHKETATALDEYKVRYEESTRQLDLLHQRMQSTMSLLETTQCELAAVKARSSKESVKTRAVTDALEATNTASATAAAQLHQMRTGYLEEKQRNVDLLLRVAQVEQERSGLRRTVAERVAETCELEQLLLEETENSERFYLRMRYHRYANELLHRFIAQLQHMQHVTSRRGRRGSGATSADPSVVFTGQPSGTLKLRHGDGDDDLAGEDTSLDILATHSHHDPNADQMEGREAAKWRSDETAKLLATQLLVACQSEEAQERAAMELEALTDLVRLTSQRARLRQLGAAAVAEKLADAEDAQRALREEVSFYKQKIKAAEAEYDEEVARHQADSSALQVAEMHRLRLERKVAALEDVNAELEGGRDSLIAKVAQSQEQQRTWQARCIEAEKLAAEVQDLLLPGASSTTSGTPTNESTGVAGGDGGGDGRPLPNTSAVFQLDRAALAGKARAAQDALDARAAMEQQCEEYCTELGAVRAQLEQARSEKHDAVAHLAGLEQTLQQAEARHTESSEQLMQEISTITRDYESRIKQQQTMMQTLRHALEEETAMADLCRQSTQRAEVLRQAQEEELSAAREACEEHRRRAEALSERCAEVQAELDQLRQHHSALERQLVELRENEPELYLLLEKGLNEDAANWLGKVRSEKQRMQKQRSDAQQLNSELLAHVRDGTTRLRDVQRQLTHASFEEGESDPDTSTMTKPSPSEDEEELAKTVRKPRR